VIKDYLTIYRGFFIGVLIYLYNLIKSDFNLRLRFFGYSPERYNVFCGAAGECTELMFRCLLL
jgi:hypothetical protein